MMLKRHLFNCMFNTEVGVCSSVVLDCNMLRFFNVVLFSTTALQQLTTSNVNSLHTLWQGKNWMKHKLFERWCIIYTILLWRFHFWTSQVWSVLIPLSGHGEWTCISIALFQSTDHSRRFTTLVRFTRSYTFIHWWQRLPCKVPTAHQEQFGLQYLAQEHLQQGGARIQTSNLPITRRSTLPPELQLNQN